MAVVLVSGRLTFCLLADKHDHRKRTGASMILSFMVGRAGVSPSTDRESPAGPKSGVLPCASAGGVTPLQSFQIS